MSATRALILFTLPSRLFRMSAFWLLLCLLQVATAPQLMAAGLIRDTEIEHYLLKIARPMAAKAGLDADSLQLRIVLDPSYNAFVSAENAIFIHSGMLIEADSMLEIAGVMAHEIGHIAAGHVPRRAETVANASSFSLLGAVLAMGLTATGNADAAAGVLAGSMDGSTKMIMAHSRQDERVADQWAIKLMEQQQYSIRPMTELMRRLASQRMLPQGAQSRYYASHPGAMERSITFKDHETRSDYTAIPQPPWMQQAHQRIRAKLRGWADPPGTTLLNTSQTENPNTAENTSFNNTAANSQLSQAELALFRRAIALFRKGDNTAALEVMENLVRRHPDDAWLVEFQADILRNNGMNSAAITAYRHSLEQLPAAANGGQIRLSLARALLASGSADDLAEAIPLLEQAVRDEPEWAFVRRQLGIAYGRSGQATAADLALAEEAMLRRDHDMASRLARRVTSHDNATAVQRQLASDILINLSQGRERAKTP